MFGLERGEKRRQHRLGLIAERSELTGMLTDTTTCRGGRDLQLWWVAGVQLAAGQTGAKRGGRKRQQTPLCDQTHRETSRGSALQFKDEPGRLTEQPLVLGGQHAVQRGQRPLERGRVDGFAAGSDLDGGQRPGKPTASPGAGQSEQRKQAGTAGLHSAADGQELVRQRKQVHQQRM